MGGRKRLVERCGDRPMRAADMTMTQMMYKYAEKSKQASAEKEARQPKRQPKKKKKPSEQTSRQLRQANSAGRG